MKNSASPSPVVALAAAEPTTGYMISLDTLPLWQQQSQANHDRVEAYHKMLTYWIPDQLKEQGFKRTQQAEHARYQRWDRGEIRIDVYGNQELATFYAPSKRNWSTRVDLFQGKEAFTAALNSFLTS